MVVSTLPTEIDLINHNSIALQQKMQGDPFPLVTTKSRSVLLVAPRREEKRSVMDPESSKSDLCGKNKRKRRKVRRVGLEREGFEYEIDNDDYLATKSVLISAGYLFEGEDDVNLALFQGTKLLDHDKGYRVSNLEIDHQGEPGERELSDEIGNLSALTKLDLYGFSIPGAIARLKNLKILCINQSRMISLPTSILQLQHLEELSITRAENLSRLPEEIGNLAA